MPHDKLTEQEMRESEVPAMPGGAAMKTPSIPPYIARAKQWLKTRRKPYTAIGITRCKCIRCGEPATCQWQICADDNNYRPLCDACDIALNTLVLSFMRCSFITSKMRKYKS